MVQLIKVVDAYTYQCSTKVTSQDLAVMASVFANAGIHPKTKERTSRKRKIVYTYCRHSNLKVYMNILQLGWLKLKVLLMLKVVLVVVY